MTLVCRLAVQKAAGVLCRVPQVGESGLSLLTVRTVCSPECTIFLLKLSDALLAGLKNTNKSCEVTPQKLGNYKVQDGRLFLILHKTEDVIKSERHLTPPCPMRC